MLKPLAALFLALASIGAAQADELLWARKSMFGGLTTISIAGDGTVFCTGCDPNNYGRIPIQGNPPVDADVISLLDPWMSTLWVVLFSVSRGNTCEAEFYAVSLLAHTLRRIDTNRLGCDTVNVSMADKGLGAVVTFTGPKGRRVVQEVK